MSTSTTTTAPAAGAKPQHLVALQGANSVRLTRARQKRAIARLRLPAGRRAVGLLVLECPSWMATAQVADVLEWPTRSGPAAARKLMGDLRIGARRQVEDLTRRQRLELAARLGVPSTPSVDLELEIGGTR